MNTTENIFKDNSGNKYDINVDLLSQIAKKLNNQQISLIFYIIRAMDKNNIIALVCRNVCKQLDIGCETYNRTLEFLEKRNFIAFTRNRIMVNPNIVFKGEKRNKKQLIHRYSKAKKK